MEIEPFRQINNLPDIASGAKPPGMVAPRMFRQAMIKDKDNNIYAVYGDRLKKGGGATAALEPWDIIELAGVGTPNSQGKFANYKARVMPGLLCGILPSNWDAEFSFSGTGIVYAVAKIQTDGTAINALEIAITSTAPAQQTPEKWKLPTSVDYLFAVIFEGSVKRTIGAGNINIAPKVWITVPKETAVGPGELPYDRYYILA